MPQHRDQRHSHQAHPRLTRTRPGIRGGFRRNPRSQAVFPPRNRSFREQVKEDRNHRDTGFPTATPALAALYRRTTPPTGWQSSPDLVWGASSTHSQPTA